MPPILARASLAALLTVTSLPVAASAESFRLDSRLALDPSPRLEAARPLDLKSPPLAVGLSAATPLALTSLGSGLMLLSSYPTEVNALSVLGMAVWATAPLALGTGQAYSGDPQRGLWVGLGTYGAITGSVLLGLGAAYAIDAQAMSAGGQSAGMRYALLTLPIASAVSVGYTIWALWDAHQTAVRHNEAVSNAQP
jgi:hypothetical protein